MSVNQKELDERLSALYGVATLGDTDASLSLFVAYGFEGSEMADRPVVIFGGESRMGRRTYLVGEIPFYDQTPIFPFLGIKRYSEDGDSHWGPFPILSTIPSGSVATSGVSPTLGPPAVPFIERKWGAARLKRVSNTE